MAEIETTSPPSRPMPSRRDDVVAEWRRFSARLTREKVISNLKTIAWVIPLTLLIWIYAEREQIQTEPNISMPFELYTTTANTTVSLKPGQDKNFILELQGPQARLQELLNRLRGGQMPQGLRIDVPPTYEVNREHTFDTLSLMQNQKIFANYGISVLGVQPSKLDVTIDQIVERDAKLVLPPGMKNVEATFAPPTVKVRGPLSVLNHAQQVATHDEAGQLFLYATLPDHILHTPGHYDVPEVLASRPPELLDDRVTIESPSKIRASVEVAQTDKKLFKPSLPVTIDMPPLLLNKYTVADFKGVVQNITLSGAPDIIDAMQRPDFQPQPKARLVVTQEDATGELRSKAVEYDLPKGVEVSDLDKKKTVEFRLVDRSPS